MAASTVHTGGLGAASAKFGADVVIASKVSKSFGEAHALRSCSFSARAGEVHALVGENGSGKSTMAKMLAGVFPPTSGAIRVNGSYPLSPREARAMGIEVVFQEILVAEGSTVLDNLFLGADGLFRARLSWREKRQRAQNLLHRLVGASVDFDALIDNLPLNMRQWIVIARALLGRPRVIVFDESTAALDHSGVERFFDVVRELRADGVCVLIVTHRIHELTSICDRATVLSDGVNVGTLSGAEITEAKLLELMRGETCPPASNLPAPRTRAGGVDTLVVSGLKLKPDSLPIDFQVGAGEIFGLAGLEGQGQVECMQAIAGFREPAAGEITAIGDERRYTIDSAHAADRAHLAYIPGDRKLEGLFPNLSVFENFGIGLYRRTGRAGIIDWKRVRRMFEEQAAALSIRMGGGDVPINSLSGGNQQKLVIGRALATLPLVLALNDPTRGVDVGTKYDLYALLRKLAAGNKTVLFLSNEIEEFVGLCDRVAVFRSQSIFRTLVGKEITSDAVLAAMFGYTDIRGMEDAER